MKRLFIGMGSLLMGMGLLYDLMPFELFAAIGQLFRSSPSTVYFRVVPIDRIDFVQASLLLIGAVLLIVGMLTRSAK